MPSYHAIPTLDYGGGCGSGATTVLEVRLGCFFSLALFWLQDAPDDTTTEYFTGPPASRARRGRVSKRGRTIPRDGGKLARRRWMDGRLARRVRTAYTTTMSHRPPPRVVCVAPARLRGLPLRRRGRGAAPPLRYRAAGRVHAAAEVRSSDGAPRQDCLAANSQRRVTVRRTVRRARAAAAERGRGGRPPQVRPRYYVT